MNDTTCNMITDWSTGERCGAPADHTWTSRDGDTYHECPDHSTHTSTRCPCGDSPEAEVAPYTIRHTASSAVITITETGEKIRTGSGSPFLLIRDGRIVARATTTKTRDKWNRDWNAPTGMVVAMLEVK